VSMIKRERQVAAVSEVVNRVIFGSVELVCRRTMPGVCRARCVGSQVARETKAREAR